MPHARHHRESHHIWCPTCQLLSCWMRASQRRQCGVGLVHGVAQGAKKPVPGAISAYGRKAQTPSGDDLAGVVRCGQSRMCFNQIYMNQMESYSLWGGWVGEARCGVLQVLL